MKKIIIERDDDESDGATGRRRGEATRARAVAMISRATAATARMTTTTTCDARVNGK